nr:Mlp family lipoprotein [Borreliella burgdorferi]
MKLLILILKELLIVKKTLTNCNNNNKYGKVQRIEQYFRGVAKDIH